MSLKSVGEGPQEALAKGTRLLFDLWWTTFQALVDAVGFDRAWELVEPYMKFHFEAGARATKEKFNLTTDDPYSSAVFLNYIYLFDGVVLGNHRFFEHGFTADVRYCPKANVAEALCNLSGCAMRAFSSILHVDYETNYARMLVRGDPFCQMMVKKRGHTIWGEVERKPVEIPPPSWSDQEREYWQSANYSQQWIYATNALVDFAGKEKAVEILRPYMKALGISIANDLSKELGIKDRDALAIASIIDRCNQAANQKGSYTYRTPERVDKEITECIFSNASQDICANALEARSNGICEAINPLYEFHSTKRMCKGDKVCHWVIKKK